MAEPRECKKCKISSFNIQQVTFKDGTEHLKRSCNQCGEFIDWATQEIPYGMFLMPFGRYKSQPLYKIVELDMNYAKWVVREFKQRSLGVRMAQVIKEFET